MRFEEVLSTWTERRITQDEAALMLGVCSRTFRRYIHRYEDSGVQGLLDKRLTQASARRAPVDEVMVRAAPIAPPSFPVKSAFIGRPQSSRTTPTTPVLRQK